MLYQIGPVQMDTFPFNADAVERDAGADFAVKPVIGGLQPREFMGEGDDTLEISGTILPSAIGGLSQLEGLHDLRRAGRSVPVMRGDGTMLGWFVILRIRERHADLERNGIGFTLEHRISLARSSPAQAAPNLVSDILDLFGLRGG